MTGLYILDAHGEPQPCDDVVTWGRWFESANRVIAHDRDEASGPGGTLVSTVFMGVDHTPWIPPPRLWESMILGGPLDGEQRRYASLAEALAGHRELCALAAAAAREQEPES